MCAVSFTFLSFGGYEWPLVVILFLGSVLVFHNFYYSDVYYSDTVHSSWKVYSILQFWICFTLFSVKVLEKTDYSGGIFIWIYGSPVLVAIVLVNNRTQTDILLLN